MQNALLLGLSFVFIGGCCTSVGYVGALVLEFSEPVTAPGLLEISASDGLNAYCAVQLPWEEEGSPSCESPDSGLPDSGLPQSQRQALALTEDGLGIAGISYIDATADHFSLLILHDGVVLHDQDHSVEYTEGDFGRIGCEKPVQSATLSIELNP